MPSDSIDNMLNQLTNVAQMQQVSRHEGSRGPSLIVRKWTPLKNWKPQCPRVTNLRVAARVRTPVTHGVHGPGRLSFHNTGNSSLDIPCWMLDIPRLHWAQRE